MKQLLVSVAVIVLGLVSIASSSDICPRPRAAQPPSTIFPAAKRSPENRVYPNERLCVI